MMLKLNDDGVLESVDEEKLVQVNEDELDELINRHNELKQFKDKVFDLIQSFKERDLLDVERILIENFEKELQE